MDKRDLAICIISDVHLGTFGCHARELNNYLKSINPEMLVLNGDIIDIWQFNKRYFPKSHMDVIKTIISLASKGAKVVYITGNHDEALRKYSDFEMGNIRLTDKLLFEINNEKTWVFHGDIFDSTTKGSAKIIAKLGSYGYDILILLNRFINWILELCGKEKMSFSKKVKSSVKKAVSWINNFEETAAELAIENNYQNVICGHIHQPQKRIINTKKGSVTYLNSGDWVENLSSLEYNNYGWNIYRYNPKEYSDLKVQKLDSQIQHNKLIVLKEDIIFKVT